MSYRVNIEDIFEGKAFMRPLFYNYEGGLRFELSQGGSYLNQFTTAHRRAMEVCRFIFSNSENIVVCVKVFGGKTALSILPCLRSLKTIGLNPGNEREYWTEFDDEWINDEDYLSSLWHYIAFPLPIDKLADVLWCALASDFGSIEPRVNASFYLFDMDMHVMVWPYDDRGMDVVGPNTDLLSGVYYEFNSYLLDHDRAIMDAVFAKKP